MSSKRMMALSLPILIIAGGLSFSKKEVYSSPAVSPNLSHAQALETGEFDPALLLVKKQRRAAAPKGFKSVEELELEKSRPKGKLPAIKKRPSKQQLEQLIKNNKGSKKAAKNAQMLSNAKKRKSSGRLRKAAPQNFKSKEELDLEKFQFKGKQPPIKKRRPRAMGDTLPVMNQPETPILVHEFSQHNDWLSRATIGAGTLLSNLNPFAVSEAHAQTPFSLVLSPTSMGRPRSSNIQFYGGYTRGSNWHFYSTSDTNMSHSNIRPYVYLKVHIPTAGYYTFNFRTAGSSLGYVLADYLSGEEIESWPSGGRRGTQEQPTILELAEGSHYFKFYSTGSSSSTRLLEVTVNSF